MKKNKRHEHKNEETSEQVITETENTIQTEEPVQTEPETQTEPVNNFEEAASAVEAQGIEPVALVEVTKAPAGTRGVLPDAFGNTVKGERICKNCGIKESETLAKNPRYSFCKGLCVNCYGKLERKTVKPSELTIPQLEEKIAYYKDLLAKKLSGAQGLPQGIADPNVTIVTDGVTTETHGANVVPTTDPTEQLATIE